MPSERFTITLDDGAETVIRHHPRPGTTRLYISHGNGFAVDGYRVFWEPLLADFDVVLFDMRNHGESPSTGADGHHYQQMARDLTTVHARVEDRLGKSTAVGVFHSMSSRAAMKNAVDFGSPYDALVLYDPPSVPPRDHALYEAMRTFELKLVSWAAERPERFGSPDETRAASAGFDRLDHAVDALTVPTLLVRGRRSDLLSEEGVADFLGRAPHAEFADVAGAGHMVVGDRNEVFNRAILGFLERQTG